MSLRESRQDAARFLAAMLKTKKARAIGTVTKISGACGVSVSTLSKATTGEAFLSVRVARDVARALELDAYQTVELVTWSVFLSRASRAQGLCAGLRWGELFVVVARIEKFRRARDMRTASCLGCNASAGDSCAPKCRGGAT